MKVILGFFLSCIAVYGQNLFPPPGSPLMLDSTKLVPAITNSSGGGGAQVWTNDTSAGNQVLQTVDQTSNLGLADYNNGHVVLSTFGPFPSRLKDFGRNTIIGNTFVAGTNQQVLTLIGNQSGSSLLTSFSSTVLGDTALSSATNAHLSVAVGSNAGGNIVNDDGGIYIGGSSGPLLGIATNSIFIGNNAITSLTSPTNLVVLGANLTATNDNSVWIGNSGQTLVLSGTTNQVSFGATNTAPVSTSSPTKWISVQVRGEPTKKYRIPLYE